MMTIGELAGRAGVSRRTIRYYVEIGLLPPPEGAGRAAGYTAEHLRRLEVVKDLQAARLTLDEIKEHLAGREWGPEAADAAPPPQGAPMMMSRLASASERLRDLQGRMPIARLRLDSSYLERPSDAEEPCAAAPAPPSPSREHREELRADQYVAEQWLRIPLSAEIELHVRKRGVRMDKRLSRLIREARRILEEEDG